MLQTYHGDARTCGADQCEAPALGDLEFCARHLPSADTSREWISGRLNAGGVNLAGADLAGAKLNGIDLERANLRGANLEEANLEGANLVRARLEGANLRRARLVDAKLGLAIAGLACLDEANLDGADLARANLVGARARGASARGANFFYSRPGGADFSEADLEGADLTRAIFRAADLRGANLDDAVGKPTLDRARTNGDPEPPERWTAPGRPENWRAGPPVIFQPFLLPEVNEANLYIVACPETRRAALIDAGGFRPEVVEFVEDAGLQVKTIFLTHRHYDHMEGLNKYLKEFGKAAVISGGAGQFGDRARHGDVFQIGNIEARIVDTSGHTDDSLSLIVGSLAFTGDAIFSGSIGGASSDTADRNERENIEKHIFTLSEATEIYGGHGPGSTVLIEKTASPFFG